MLYNKTIASVFYEFVPYDIEQPDAGMIGFFWEDREPPVSEFMVQVQRVEPRNTIAGHLEPDAEVEIYFINEKRFVKSADFVPDRELDDIRGSVNAIRMIDGFFCRYRPGSIAEILDKECLYLYPDL